MNGRAINPVRMKIIPSVYLMSFPSVSYLVNILVAFLTETLEQMRRHQKLVIYQVDDVVPLLYPVNMVHFHVAFLALGFALLGPAGSASVSGRLEAGASFTRLQP